MITTLSMVLFLAPALAPREAHRYASDIESAARGDREIAAALATVAHTEGGFAWAIERCEITGDAGAAISLYQLHPQHIGRHSRAEVCQSNAVATRLAAGLLRHLREKAGGDWRTAFQWYAGARSASHWKVSLKYDTMMALLRG